MSGSTGTFAYANGTYVTSASSSSVVDGATYEYAYNAFNNFATSKYWHVCYYSSGNTNSGNNSLYGNAVKYTQSPYTGSYTYQGGGVPATNYYSTSVSGTTYNGEWLQIMLPYKLVLTSYYLQACASLTRPFKYFYIAGSNDGSNWSMVDNQGTSTCSTAGTTYNVTSSIGYLYYRMICSGGDSAGTLIVQAFNLYGSVTI